MKDRTKKILNMIPYAFLAIAFALLVSLSFSLKNGNTPTVLGRAIFIVVSPSMEDTIMVGDVIIINTNADEFTVGDIITFHNPSEPEMIITHRIISIETVDGVDYFTTMGDNNDLSFDWETGFTSDYIIGKYVCKSALIGEIYRFIFANGFNLVFIMIITVFVIVGGMEISTIIKQLSMAKTQKILEEKEKMIQAEIERLQKQQEEDK